jgi:hypothetical protein
VPTICPQLQITPVKYSDGFPQFRYPAAVSTSLSKRHYTPAVGGSIPSAPTNSRHEDNLADVLSRREDAMRFRGFGERHRRMHDRRCRAVE